jgi:hypothetical protein
MTRSFAGLMRGDARFNDMAMIVDPPPMKWSGLMYGF